MDVNLMKEWHQVTRDTHAEIREIIGEGDITCIYWWSAIDDCDFTFDGIFGIEHVIKLGKLAEKVQAKRDELLKKYQETPTIEEMHENFVNLSKIDAT